MIFKIQSIILNIKHKQKTIQWMPAHKNIEGNGITDVAVKTTLY